MADAKDDEDGVAGAVTEGVRVGDFVLRPAVSLSTDDHLDTNENRERARQEEDDARAAQQAGVVAPGGLDLLHRAAPPAPAHTALDDALDEARARLDGTADMPMILHDPVTGEPVRGN
jgi:hypothetical protein